MPVFAPGKGCRCSARSSVAGLAVLMMPSLETILSQLRCAAPCSTHFCCKRVLPALTWLPHSLFTRSGSCTRRCQNCRRRKLQRVFNLPYITRHYHKGESAAGAASYKQDAILVQIGPDSQFTHLGLHRKHVHTPAQSRDEQHFV